MTSGTRVLIAAIVVGVTACTSHIPGADGVGKRLAFKGYSVLPPEGGGWIRKDPPGTDAGFFTTAHSPDHRFLLVASTRTSATQFASPQEFLDYVIRQQEAEADPHRFHLLAESISLDPAAGRFCVKSSASAEDRASTPHPILDGASIVCVHPSSPGLIVTVAYSELHQRSETAPELSTAGERFLDSLRFFDVP